MSNNLEKKGSLPWKSLFLSGFFGIVFLLVNFPIFLTKIVTNTIHNQKLQDVLLFPVTSVQNFSSLVISASPENTFQHLMSYNFLLFSIFLLLVIIFSIRHLDWRLIALCLLGLVIGFSALHLISWMATIIISILLFIMKILVGITSFLWMIISFIIFKGWWVLLILLFIGLIINYIGNLLKFFAGVLITTGILYLLFKIAPTIWRWFVNLISPVAEFIKMVWIKYVGPIIAFIILLITKLLIIGIFLLGFLLVITTLGNLVIDQIRAAWSSGKGRKGIILGGFAIGSAIALIILTSVAAPPVANGVNEGWNSSFGIISKLFNTDLSSNAMARIEPTNLFVKSMPSSVKTFVFEYLTNVKPPIIDSILLLTILFIAITSIFIRLFPAIKEASLEKPINFLPREYFVIFGGLLLSVVIIFFQALSEGDS